jgi:hypothetical protein
VSDEELRISAAGGEGYVWKGEPTRSFDLTANVRTIQKEGPDAGFGFVFIDNNGGILRKLLVGTVDGQSVLRDTLSGISLPLPSSYQEEVHRQFRFIRLESKLRIESEDRFLGELEMDSNPTIVGIFTKGATVACEMIRWTPLADVESE